MEADEAGSDSAIPPHTKHLLISAASCSVDQSSSSSSSVCGGLNTVPSNTQLHLAGHLAGGQNSCSDDSGCVVHTNSSISDSSRVYLNCKHDFEVRQIIMININRSNRFAFQNKITENSFNSFPSSSSRAMARCRSLTRWTTRRGA